jgi:hypothetical protein
MSTRKNQPASPKAATPDANFAHVAVGLSNEELIQKQAQLDQLRSELGYPKVELTADAEDKKNEAWGDLDYDPLGLTDPLAQIKKDYQRPGMALKLLSDSVNDRLGRRGYQIVRDANGDPVRCGKMVVGEIPEAVAAKRRRAPIERSNDELRSIKDNQRLAVEKMKDEAKGMGLQVLEPGDVVTNVGNAQDYQMGMTVDRGEDGAK